MCRNLISIHWLTNTEPSLHLTAATRCGFKLWTRTALSLIYRIRWSRGKLRALEDKDKKSSSVETDHKDTRLEMKAEL